MSVFICAASGPSLTQHDCELAMLTGLPIVAVNDTWKLFPQLYALYAGDERWWQQHYSAVPKTGFRRVTASAAAKEKYSDLEYLRFCSSRESFNSGSMAIEFAAAMGARKIILIGYDCCLTHGVHWHGAHPAGLKNPTQYSIDKWHGEYWRAKRKWAEVEIINCSRHTELKCYPSRSLEMEIASLSLVRAQA